MRWRIGALQGIWAPPQDPDRCRPQETAMESDALDARKRAIQQLVVELLAPYHARLQPMELAWPLTSPASHDQQLWLTLQQESAPRVIIHFTPDQLETACSPHDGEAYAHLKAYIWEKVRPLLHP
jgi:hypothetical protein